MNRTLRVLISMLAAGAVGAGCARMPAGTPPLPSSPISTASQLVVVVTPNWGSTSGMLSRFERNEKAQWRQVAETTPVVVGRTGVAWGDSSLARSADPVKREGDGRAPAGAFPLDTAFGFAAAQDAAWLHVPYASLTDGSDCVDDTQSAYYNTVVDRARVPRVDWTSAEHMRTIGQYRLGVIVGYNAPPVRGRGSCIFLHIWSGPSSSTAGCTAMEAAALQALMAWLDAARRPMLVQLPRAEYERLRAAWMLPRA